MNTSVSLYLMMTIELIRPVTIELTVRDCPRCRGTHEHLEVKPLKHPAQFTHFAQCPTTNEPIVFDDDFGLDKLTIRDGDPRRYRKEPD